MEYPRFVDPNRLEGDADQDQTWQRLFAGPEVVSDGSGALERPWSDHSAAVGSCEERLPLTAPLSHQLPPQAQYVSSSSAWDFRHGPPGPMNGPPPAYSATTMRSWAGNTDTFMPGQCTMWGGSQDSYMAGHLEAPPFPRGEVTATEFHHHHHHHYHHQYHYNATPFGAPPGVAPFPCFTPGGPSSAPPKQPGQLAHSVPVAPDFMATMPDANGIGLSMRKGIDAGALGVSGGLTQATRGSPECAQAPQIASVHPPPPCEPPPPPPMPPPMPPADTTGVVAAAPTPTPASSAAARLPIAAAAPAAAVTRSTSEKGSKEKRTSGGEGRAAKLRRNKWINRQVTRSADAGNLPRLLQTVEFHINEMNGINLATALHRVTKLAVNGSSGLTVSQLLKNPCFLLLRSTVVKHIEQHKQLTLDLSNAQLDQSQQPLFEVQCMSIVCWSCATLRLHEEELLATIADIVLRRLEELKPFELSNMTWAYAKLSAGSAALFQAVSERMSKRQEGEFGVQCLSMIAWSFATAKKKDNQLFVGIAQEMTAIAHLTKSQEIANTLWAYAKNRCAEVGLFNALADTAIENSMLWAFKPQELSNTLWSFATIGHQHPALFKNAVAVAICKRYQLSPQNIANILWAYAKLQACRRSGLFPALLGVSVGMMPKHKPQEISAIVWAAAKESYPDCQRFFGATAQTCTQRLHEFPPQALANMLEAFAVIEADAPSFSEAMACESVGRLHQFEPTALANLFRGAVLVARRARSAVSAGSPSSATSSTSGLPGGSTTKTKSKATDRQLQVLSAIGAHIAQRVDELQAADLVHIEHSLQLLGGPTLRAHTGGLDRIAMKRVSANRAGWQSSRKTDGSASQDASQDDQDQQEDDLLSINWAEMMDREGGALMLGDLNLDDDDDEAQSKEVEADLDNLGENLAPFKATSASSSSSRLHDCAWDPWGGSTILALPPSQSMTAPQ